MNKEEVIEIVTGMGFHLGYDNWSDEDGWMRFELNQDLDEKDLRLIWWKEATLNSNLARASKILFLAGQKAKIQQLNKYITL